MGIKIEIPSSAGGENFPPCAARRVSFAASKSVSLRRVMTRIVLVFLIATTGRADVVIHEFVATNSDSLRDEDGESSDWIELRNCERVPVDVGGWFLTDDADELTRWSFPAVVLDPGAYLVVFASGKDRRDASGELHTSFRLDGDGEYLALVRPDGRTIAHEFAPAYPEQRRDVGFGTGEEVVEPRLVALGDDVRIFVPANDPAGAAAIGNAWTGGAEPFDDSLAAGWTNATTGIGYDVASEAAPQDDRRRLIGYWSFDDLADRELTVDSSGNDHHGTITSRFALTGEGGTANPVYTTDGSGHTGLPGDRSLDFGVTGNGALVDIPAAATGAFDRARENDAISISLWIFGGTDQPARGSIFWGSGNELGTGVRSLNAHAPWSDRTIYWDTAGCCDETTRISKPEPSSIRWQGEWNHYVFIKNGDRKEIWQNGVLFHEGNNPSPLTPIRNFTIGGAKANGPLGYGGRIDDVAVWDGALERKEIENLSAGASPLDLSEFRGFIASDVEDALRGRGSSLYVRAPFELREEPTPDTALVLRVRYDDGFAAYLNGVEVARRNALAELTFDARAESDRPRGDATTKLEEIDLSEYLGSLNLGRNVFAIHALNDRADSPDFLIAPELVLVRRTADRYLSPSTPGEANSPGLDGFVDDTRFSVDRGFFDAPIDVEISSETEDAEIYYSMDGSEPGPDAEAATRYSGPIRVDETTTLRARAFKANHLPTNVDTQTYLFIASTASQPRRPEGFPASWSEGVSADYAVDPDVVESTLPGFGFEEALRAIPSMSIVMPPEDLFGSSRGIYYHSRQKTERGGSIEYIDPDGEREFQSDAGVRIHGLTSAWHSFTKKHSFRVVFKSRFGPTKLDFPLFDGSPVEKFDQFVLKGLSTDTWPVEDGWHLSSAPPGTRRWHREDALYMREQWMKDSLREMGQTSTFGRYVHLYLNGLYWGLYNLTERPTDSFNAEHRGGEKEEYDVIRDFAELQSGSRAAWNEMMTLASNGLETEAAYQRIQGNHPDGTRNLDYPVYVDVDSLIDYMILHIYAGADDWPNHNWWAARRRGPDSDGFKFYAWDQEISNNSNNRFGFSAWGVRFELASAAGTPSFLYDRMRGNRSFQIRFADRVARHFAPGGALSREGAEARWESRAIEIDRAIVGESARWGDARRTAPYKREVEWLAARDWITGEYLDGVVPQAFARFRRVDLYPALDVPIFRQHGGRVPMSWELTMAAAEGTTYFTVDGSDPRARNGTVSPTASVGEGSSVTITGPVTVKARARSGGEWSALSEAFFYVEEPLRITEIMYHPPASDPGDEFSRVDYEFVEFQNIASTPLRLEGFRVRGGVEAEFAAGDALAPGEIVVLVKNTDAFRARYGDDPRVAGEFSGQLRNSGERLEIRGPLDGLLLAADYSDEWHPSTDGEGRSLAIVDARAPAESWSAAGSWRPSVRRLGTPGFIPSVDTGAQRQGDYNQDGDVNIADGINALLVLFADGELRLPCGGEIDDEANRRLFDLNGDASFDLSDPIYLFEYLFQDGRPPVLGVECLPTEGCAVVCGAGE